MHHHHCIFVNLVNIMLSTALCQTFLSEHRTSSVSMFVARSCVRSISEFSLMSRMTVSRQIVFGLPIGLFVGLMNLLSASCAGVSCSSRSKRPNHVNRLLRMVMLQGWNFVLWYCPWSFHVNYLSLESSLERVNSVSRLLVTVHISEL